MDVGIGLPNTARGPSGAQRPEGARGADGRGFSSLGTIDRIVYDNYEVLTALAAAAAVTERIGLCTSVLLGPLRENPVELAKQALSVHALSGGRLTLGIGLGGRDDDYEISGLETKGRGKRLDEMLERMREIWDGDEVGPSSEGSPRVVIGGAADASFARTARFGEGWIAGGSSPDEYAEMAGKVKAAWSEAGREGEPRLMSLAYFALGDSAEADADASLTDYYAWLGEETAGYIAGSAAKDAETVRRYVAAFTEAGCGELIFCPSSNDPDQVALLADAPGNCATGHCGVADDLPILLFTTPPDFEVWLEENHAESEGFWLKIAKKGSGKTSISYAEGLELALCFGWIDSQKRGLDEKFFLQRFTPRRPRGRWSRINREKVEALLAAEAMRPAGMAEVEAAKADGRWEAAYEGARTAKVPDDLRRELDANEDAREFFATLDSGNRCAIFYRLDDAKKPETRERRLRKFVAMLERGEKIH